VSWIDIPTEQTTAVTDLMFAMLSGCGVLYLARFRHLDRRKALIWCWGLGFLVMATFSGFLVHGFVMSEQVSRVLWQPISLGLGVAIALFVAGAIHDVWGERASGIAVPVMVLVGVGFYGIKCLFSGAFLMVLVYEAAAMFFAFGAYVFLAVRRNLRYGRWMAAAILVTIIAAVVQATKKVHFTLVWEFDHNGVFHMLQGVGIALLLVGLTRSFTCETSADGPPPAD